MWQVRLTWSLVWYSPHLALETHYQQEQAPTSSLYGIQLSSDLLTAAPSATPDHIIADQYQTPASSTGDTSGNYTEGPYQLINGNYIYLFYSRGDCCTAGSTNVPSVYQT